MCIYYVDTPYGYICPLTERRSVVKVDFSGGDRCVYRSSLPTKGEANGGELDKWIL